MLPAAPPLAACRRTDIPFARTPRLVHLRLYILHGVAGLLLGPGKVTSSFEVLLAGLTKER